MKKVIIAALLILAIGAALFLGGSFAMGFDFKKLDNRNYIERTEEFADPFENIILESGDIRILPSEDGKCRAVFTESEKISYTSGIEDGTLTIRRSDDRKWYEYIGFHFKNCGVELYLPQADYNTLKIHAASGSIDVAEGLSFHHANIETASGSIRVRANIEDNLFAESSSGSMDISGVNARGISLSASSGSLKLSNIDSSGAISISKSSGSIAADNIRCESMDIRVTSGSSDLHSVIATGKISIDSSSGSIRLEGCDANEFKIESTSGSVKAALLSGKVFDVHATSGSIDVPASVEGSGVFSAVTTSGSIKVSVK